MTVGPMEGLSSALGDELTRLSGYRSTRVSAQFGSSEHKNYGVDNATANAAGDELTLSGDQEFANVVAGDLFRILGNTAYAPTVEATVASVSTDRKTITITGQTYLGVVDVSWEIFTAASKRSLQVETTHEWETNGRFIMDGALWRYTGKSPSHFLDVERHNSEIFVYASSGTYQPGEEVVDYSQAYSGVDQMRESFLVDFATGEDLDVLGRNLSVRRPNVLTDDEAFREMIKAVAYTPHGTMWVVELLLTALVGVGNYEIFEDLTAGPQPGDPGTAPATYPAQIFVSINQDTTDLSCKSYLHAFERRPMASGTTVVTSETPLFVEGVRMASEGAPRTPASGGVFASGVPGTLVGTYDSGSDTLVVSGGPFPSGQPLPGDQFYVSLGSGSYAGRAGTVKERVSNEIVHIGAIEGYANSPVLRQSFSNVGWKFERTRTDARHSKPSQDLATEYPGDPGRQMWQFVGTDVATEAADAILADTVEDGRHLRITNPADDATLVYRQDARIDRESFATFDALVAVSGSLSSLDNNADQVAVRLFDGVRLSEVGYLAAPGGAWGGLTDGTGTFLTSGVAVPTGSFFIPSGLGSSGSPSGSVASGIWHRVAIEKHDDRHTVLLVNGVEVERVEYSDLPLSALTPRREIGSPVAGSADAEIWFKELGWHTRSPRDLWNSRVYEASGSLVAPTTINSTGLFPGPFSGASVGDLIRVHEPGSDNAAGGNARGEWEIETVTGPESVEVEGVTQRNNAHIDPHSKDEVWIRGAPRSFRYPDVLGHTFVFESGPNSGESRTVIAALRPDGTDYATVDPPSAFTNRLQLSADVEVTEDADWRIDPVFGTTLVDDPGVQYEVVAQGSQAGTTLTLPNAFPFSAPAAAALVEVAYIYSLCPSPYLADASESNATLDPFVNLVCGFFLPDDGAWVQTAVDLITAAGVHVDLHRMLRDDAGVHIL